MLIDYFYNYTFLFSLLYFCLIYFSCSNLYILRISYLFLYSLIFLFLLLFLSIFLSLCPFSFLFFPQLTSEFLSSAEISLTYEKEQGEKQILHLAEEINTKDEEANNVNKNINEIKEENENWNNNLKEMKDNMEKLKMEIRKENED